LLRDVAIKMLLPELMADKANVEIFRQEARLAAQLEHPNIVTVYDIGLEERQKKHHHFVCMEYLPGGNLATRLAIERLEVELCLNWMKQLAAGLAFAHRRNVVHQDIKADNIFITNEGDLKIGDFGLARLLVGRVHYDATIKGMGTPAYMSPELCRGEPQDERSDIYSLGILFFEMATGQLPFKARGMIEMATKHSSAPIPSARRINPLIPEVLDKLIRRMMAKLPEERYASMAEVLTLLDDLIFEMRVKRMGLSTSRPIMRSGPIATEAVEATKNLASSASSSPALGRQPSSRVTGFDKTQAVEPQAIPASVADGGRTSRDLIAQLEAKEVRTPEAKTSQAAAAPEARAASSRETVSPANPVNPFGKPQSIPLPSGKTADSGAGGKTAALAKDTAGGADFSPRTTPSKPPASASGTAAFKATSSGDKIKAQTVSGAHRVLQGPAWRPALEPEWRFQSMGPIGWSSAPVLDKAEEKFFISSTDGTVYVGDLDTGEVTWKYQVGEPMISSPVLIGDKLVLADASGRIQSVTIGAKEPSWSQRLPGSVLSTPALSRDLVFVPTTSGQLFALEIFTGSKRWTYKADDSIVCSPHRHADLVLFGTKGGDFFAVSADTGRQSWKFAAGAPIVSSPAASVDSVYFGTQAGNFFALEAATGGLVWEYPTDKPIVSKAVIAFTSVIFCSHDRWLYCCEKYDGSLKWKASVRGKSVANLTLHRECVLVATQEGWVQAFSSRNGTLLWQLDLARRLESPPVIAREHLLQATVEGEVLSLSTETGDGAEKLA
jgi:serine/threonine protein kinase/outer membrane protein assembly factor BamB